MLADTSQREKELRRAANTRRTSELDTRGLALVAAAIENEKKPITSRSSALPSVPLPCTLGRPFEFIIRRISTTQRTTPTRPSFDSRARKGRKRSIGQLRIESKALSLSRSLHRRVPRLPSPRTLISRVSRVPRAHRAKNLRQPDPIGCNILLY